MNTLKLLPRWFRFLGLAFIIPSIAIFIYNPEISFGDMSIFKEPSGTFVFKVPAFFDQDFIENGESVGFAFVHWIKNDLSNEVLLTMMLLGTYFIAFAKIKGEDEFSKQLRLEAMVQAIVWNSALLLLLNFMTYGGLFLYVMISQLFSFLLIFSTIFALMVRKQKKALGHEE
ncbi:MAG: hypothetical protein JKY48_03710 [Flavobacteriales bacterium]|nr:hypothetical protein [Flavobacteriales bacterium]